MSSASFPLSVFVQFTCATINRSGWSGYYTTTYLGYLVHILVHSTFPTMFLLFEIGMICGHANLCCIVWPFSHQIKHVLLWFIYMHFVSRFCGTFLPYYRLTSDRDELLVVFRSDFHKEDCCKGFKMNVCIVVTLL